MKRSEPKRDFNYVWDLIDSSVIILVVYSLLELIFSVSIYIDKIFPVAIFSIILSIFAFSLIGYEGRKKKEEAKYVARFGAYAGLIVGFVSAIIGIVTFYFYPEKIALALQKARESGADMAVVQSMMKIGIYINIVLLPAINAGIGALIAWISFLIFRKE